MHSLVKRNGADFDLQTMMGLLRGEPPKWRLLHLQGTDRGGELWRTMKESVEQSSDKLLWEHLDQNVHTSNIIFALCVRPASVIFELIAAKTRLFPMALLQLLSDKSKAQPLLDHARRFPCLLDPWTESFFQKYDSEEKVLSQDAQQELHATAAVLSGNTWAIESQHSRHARRSRTRVHTHTMALAQVSMWNYSWGAPAFVPRPFEDRDSC